MHLDFTVKQLQVTLQLVPYNISLMLTVGLPCAMIVCKMVEPVLKMLSKVIWMPLDTQTVKFSLLLNKILLISLVSLDQTLLVSKCIILRVFVMVLKQATAIVKTLLLVLLITADTKKIYMLFVVAMYYLMKHT